MKKLLFTLSAIACAVSVQAATFSWANTYSINVYDQPGSQGAVQASGTMYLINAATEIDLGGGNMQALTQAYFVETVVGAGIGGYEAAFNALVANSVNNGSLTANSKFASAKTGTIDTGKVIFGTADETGTPMSFYQVLLDTENKGLYISEAIDVTVSGAGDTYLWFENNGAYDELGKGTNPYPMGTMTFQGDGWYTAVPEPTSGLLLLFGLAGLALKRKRV